MEGHLPWLPAAPDTRAGDQRRSGRIRIGADAVVADSAILRGPVDIGACDRIGARAWLERAVVLLGALIPEDQVVIGGIVG